MHSVWSKAVVRLDVRDRPCPVLAVMSGADDPAGYGFAFPVAEVQPVGKSNEIWLRADLQLSPMLSFMDRESHFLHLTTNVQGPYQQPWNL